LKCSGTRGEIHLAHRVPKGSLHLGLDLFQQGDVLGDHAAGHFRDVHMFAVLWIALQILRLHLQQAAVPLHLALKVLTVEAVGSIME
jgi:hypothetical protein